jgi:hypothetical protein
LKDRSQLFVRIGNDEIVSQIVAAGAVPRLLNALSLPTNTSPTIAVQQNLKMLEAATRALKAIYSSSKVSLHINTENMANELMH